MVDYNIRYWLMAKTTDGRTLITHNSFGTIQEVQRRLETWSKSYELAEAWADARRGGKSLGKITFQRVWRVKVDLYEGKALRDIINELHPEQVNSIYTVGIMGCPSDYRTPVDLSPYDRCTAPDLSDMPKSCEECWNQIYGKKGRD